MLLQICVRSALCFVHDVALNQSEELKFCTVCGANLSVVRQAVETRETDERTDPSNPWFAALALSDAASQRRKDELDHRRGIAPEVTRYNEIRGGVITGSVGLAVAIFLHIFMQGLILSGKVSPDVAEILNRIWLVGIIPLFTGIALDRQWDVCQQATGGDCQTSSIEGSERTRRKTRTRFLCRPLIQLNSFLQPSA